MNLKEAKEYFSHDKYATEATGIEILEVTDQYAKCLLKLGPRHRAAHDHVMGGVMFTVADFTFAAATNTPEKLTITTSSTINYLGQPKDDTLISQCHCVKEGRTICFYQIDITDGQGNPVAIVNSTGMHVPITKYIDK